MGMVRVCLHNQNKYQDIVANILFTGEEPKK